MGMKYLSREVLVDDNLVWSFGEDVSGHESIDELV
jgi:hypothetical protein